jgi:hypothetical protein
VVDHPPAKLARPLKARALPRKSIKPL